VNLVFDTGMLIALERRKQRAVAVASAARVHRHRMIVPSACIAEWWRGRTDAREKILDPLFIRHTDDALVKIAGEAVAAVPRATVVDALVMATAARFGGVVYTSDVDDMMQLQRAFPAVRVLAV
jgi:hypothetical protein